MKFTRQDFSFELPEKLIAQQPTTERTKSRLLVMEESGQVSDKVFTDLLSYLNPEDCLIFNNTKVIPARLFGKKLTGAKVELLIERVLDETTILTHIRSSRSPKEGTKLLIEDSFEVEVIGRDDALFIVKIQKDNASSKSALELIEAHGHMPLPPYISREDELEDKERYQTVYSDKAGAVAAPTAGLHFDLEFIEAIKQKGIETGFVTLHVGAGTFRPVQVDNIAEHRMHSEVIEVLDDTVELIKRTKKNGGRVFGVGTTSVRSLESAFKFGGEELKPYRGETDIFITPGVKFNVVDVLLTNFHLPESTLIMLVSALAGFDRTMSAYNHAVEQEYRFFSYGDAMLVFPEKC